MSVIVKGIKMPDCCEHCYLEHFGICTPTRSTVSIPDLNKKLDNCPLIELPKKHGRLIDGDALWDAMSKYNDNEGAKMPFGYDDTSIHIDSACFVIENAPTVIEAE